MKNLINRRGISLVALIITIIVLIILTGAVIINVTGENNTIGKASEAVFKNDMTTFREDLRNNILNEQAKTTTISSKSDVNPADWAGIRQWIPSATEKYNGKLTIINGELYYAGEDTNEIACATELNMYPVPNAVVKNWTLTEDNGNNGISVGDLVTYKPKQTEQFYIISVNGDNVSMLASKNIDTGTLEQSDSAPNCAFSNKIYWEGVPQPIHLI